MNLSPLLREAKFVIRDRAFITWMLVVLSLSVVSLSFGLVEVDHQQASLQQLRDADLQDRSTEFSKVNDWGSAAYYSFHLTCDPPSTFAFAAIGQRDLQPWKHRIRMLALEGQIYERDTGNPSIALVGRFDFAFLAAFIIPLVLIMLLYDLKSGEKTAGRYNLLEATKRRGASLWRLRTGLRASAIFMCLAIPLLVAGVIAGTAVGTLIQAMFMLIAYTAFWAFICYRISGWHKPGPTILTALIGVWLFTAVILPAGARLVIDRWVALPTGAEILLLQRETVNDAWDLPRNATMDAFFERHPQWSDYVPDDQGFEWPWYYAFQQMGDQRTEVLTQAYREGRLKRDRLAAWVSVLAPPSLLERALQSLAQTDIKAAIGYEDKVRQFHAELKTFYYPRFFRHSPFDSAAIDDLPVFCR